MATASIQDLLLLRCCCRLPSAGEAASHGSYRHHDADDRFSSCANLTPGIAFFAPPTSTFRQFNVSRGEEERVRDAADFSASSRRTAAPQLDANNAAAGGSASIERAEAEAIRLLKVRKCRQRRRE